MGHANDTFPSANSGSCKFHAYVRVEVSPEEVPVTGVPDHVHEFPVVQLPVSVQVGSLVYLINEADRQRASVRFYFIVEFTVGYPAVAVDVDLKMKTPALLRVCSSKRPLVKTPLALNGGHNLSET